MAEENTPKKPGPGTRGISELVEFMETNNKSSAKIEKDGRNTRRHLLEIKKLNTSMLDVQQRTLTGFEKFFSIMDTQSLQSMEDNKENLTLFQEIRKSLANIDKNTAKGFSSGGGKDGGGFLSNFGGMAGTFMGAGAGIASLGLAIPAFFGALQAGNYGLGVLDTNFNFENIKKAALGFADLITDIPQSTLITLGGLMAVSAFTGNPLKMALGFSLLGAAIPGFFGGFAIGDAALSMSGLDLEFTSVKKAVAGFVGVIGEIPNDLDGAKIAGLLGTGILIGATKGVKGSLGVATGMAALGAGISGFFAGFALGDFAISKLGDIDYTSIKSAMVNFGDSITALSAEAELKLVALLGAGGLIGTLTGFGTQAKITTGMASIGAGIGGFFTGFAAMDKISSVLGTDGSNTKKLMQNFSEGIGALDTKVLGALGVFMMTGAALALFTGGVGSAVAAAGIGAMGASLAAFFMAFDGVAAVGGALGINGSSTKILFTNLADGINALTGIGADGDSILKLSAGIGALGPAIALFLGGKGLGGVISTITGAGGKVKDFVGSFFGAQGGKSLFEEIAESLEPIVGLNANNSLGEFNKFTESMIAITTNRGIDAASESYERFGDTILNTAEKMQLAFEGGMIGDMGLRGMSSYQAEIDNLNLSLSQLQEDIASDVNITATATPIIASLFVDTLSAENAILKLPDSSQSSGAVMVNQGGDTIRGGDTIIVHNNSSEQFIEQDSR